MATLIEVSTRILQTLGNPDTPVVGAIQYYLRHNIGALNTLLNTSYTIDATDGTVEPDLIEDDAAIFQLIYLIYYYENKIRENLGAAAIDPVLEVSENGAVVRLTNRNAISLSYIQLKKQEEEKLNQLITFYRTNRSTPQNIDGDDTTDTFYDGVNSVRTTS